MTNFFSQWCSKMYSTIFPYTENLKLWEVLFPLFLSLKNQHVSVFLSYLAASICDVERRWAGWGTTQYSFQDTEFILGDRTSGYLSSIANFPCFISAVRFISFSVYSSFYIYILYKDIWSFSSLQAFSFQELSFKKQGMITQYSALSRNINSMSWNVAESIVLFPGLSNRNERHTWMQHM